MPNFPIKYHEWPYFKDLTLADPMLYIENEIDILLGADVFMTLISGTPIMGPKDHSLKQFWELESVPKDIPSKDELCESIFLNSHIRNADGRYILKLPFRDDSSLGDSKEGALKRFYSLERKLHSNNQLKEQTIHRIYGGIPKPWSHDSSRIRCKISTLFLTTSWCAINDNSSTTKLRVVFDGSFKSTNGNFLNDILLTAGADSLNSARKTVHELQNLMSASGFELRKSSRTHPEVLSGLPNTLKTNISSHSFDVESTQKVLGLFWDLNEDSFKVRAVVSDQIILQDLCKTWLDWDDEISSDILNRWNRFQAEISCLKQIKVPRYVQTLNAKHCEIHGFCDASSKAYSAVIYLRVVSDSPHLFLMASKTSVAPVQKISLPKLELCGALLLAELLDTFKKLNITHDTYTAGQLLSTDNTIIHSNHKMKGSKMWKIRMSAGY
ncbi:DUF1758 domain-containing protein [Trichonephila clavipes]|nr:DUF1758 domain-containing protein [Trichonephila clavipes]